MAGKFLAHLRDHYRTYEHEEARQEGKNAQPNLLPEYGQCGTADEKERREEQEWLPRFIGAGTFLFLQSFGSQPHGPGQAFAILLDLRTPARI